MKTNTINLKKNVLITTFVGVCAFVAVVLVLMYTNPVNAADTSKFKAGYIISDAVFTNKGSMSVSQIQSFLNSKVTTCDTNGTQLSEYGGPDLNGDGKVQRWEWGKQYYNQTTFPCLKDYKVDNVSAAQIIYNAAQKHSISPRVLIVLLQKEQALVTDTWPLNIQYRSATGYGCPDTAACDSQYYGLVNQLDWAAYMFRSIMNANPNWYTPYILGSNQIPWNPDTARCGYSTVTIENKATQALYNYTPYRPNQAALDAGYGTGDSCSSHGNRNFYLYFTDWFGSTTTSYDATITSTSIYSDAAMTVALDPTNPVASPGQTVYVKVIAKNIGAKTLENSYTRIATIDARNRINSLFYNSSWLTTNRPAAMKELTALPTEQATFEFPVTVPYDTGVFTEYFGLVADGKTWMDGDRIKLSINVQANQDYAAKITETKFYLDAAMTKETTAPRLYIKPDQKLYVRVKAKNIGIQTLNSSSTKVATIDPHNRTDSIFYNTSWLSTNRPASMKEPTVAPAQIGTFEFSIKLPEIEGLYSELFGLVAENLGWMDTQKIAISQTLKSISPVLYPGERLYPGEYLMSTNEKYKLVMQGDGNMVIYSPNRAIWSSQTNGKGSSRLVMQNDGNLVIYKDGASWTWASWTQGKE